MTKKDAEFFAVLCFYRYRGRSTFLSSKAGNPVDDA